jgi:uncharacterized protein
VRDEERAQTKNPFNFNPMDGAMTLKKKIDAEMVAAAKAKDSIKLGAIRMIKTALHNKEIDTKRELNDAEILQVLSTIVKQRKDSIEQFKAGKRQDLVEKEEAELATVQSFMPQQMSAGEVEAEVAKAITEAGATSVKDMGKVMKVLMPRITGKADGKMVSDLVKAKLSS